MSFDGRVTRLERARGVPPADRVPTWAVVVYDPDAAPRDPDHVELYKDRIRQTLPWSLVTVMWCADNGRGSGPHIVLGGPGWVETRPIPDVSGDEW